MLAVSGLCAYLAADSEFDIRYNRFYFWCFLSCSVIIFLLFFYKKVFFLFLVNHIDFDQSNLLFLYECYRVIVNSDMGAEKKNAHF
jgi:hypothetical protein